MPEEPQLVPPWQYPKFYCPYCGCHDSNKVKIREAWRDVSKPWNKVVFGTEGFCDNCGTEFDMTLKQVQAIFFSNKTLKHRMQPYKNKKKRK